MIKQLKQFTVNLLAGANVVTVLLMVGTGYVDHLHPADHPLLSPLGMVFPLFLVFNLLFLLMWLIVKWRKMWIPIVGYLLAYVPISTYMPLNAKKDVPDGSIKMISYNVCCYGGNYKYEDAFERILDYFKQQDADIVCLQEDVDTWRRYAFNSYRKIYPYNDTTVLCHTPAAYNAVGMHTRYPILRKERIAYKSKANGSIAYFLKAGDDTLLVINNHLESSHLTKEDRSRYTEILRGEMESDTVRAKSMLIIDKLGEAAAKRAPAVEAIMRYANEHRQYPTIICGDFNDTPISYTRHALSKSFTDCYKKTGRGIGLSYNQKGFWVRIDHIFCSSDLTPYNCYVDSEIDFSDHYPMICWLKMQDK